ncbi:MAG: alpha/beta hydrolase [Deltaproteobacteria bacterium]|nr:alpha/beta hydrolase [Candidatus Zymogenaceae bacterium]
MKKMIPKKEAHDIPILFVHGAWHGAWCWENFMNFLSEKGFACHAVDLPAHGERRGDGENISRQTFMEYVREVGRVAGDIGNPIVIGHSLGGYVVMKYLEEATPPAAVLVAPLPFRHFPRTTFLKMALHYPSLAVRFGVLLPLPVRDEKMYRRLFLHNAPDEVCRRGSESAVPESSVALLTPVVPLTRLKPHRVSTPVLVTAAEHDYFFPIRTQERTARAYRGDYRMYRGMGHNLMTENGWERVADDIHDWLVERIGTGRQPR